MTINRYPLGSATPDSVLRTYVELGFFEPVAADTTSGELPGYDHHYCVVVNRRAFSTADRWVKTNIAGTDSVQLVSDARYNTMLDLTETRRIALKLNVEHPADSTERYTWYRVREIAPDTRSLPGSTTLRHVLDTIVHGRDSVVHVTLRPGGSTLLEMTPIRPDSTIYTGSLAYNSQRKILWDGLRYHCAYVAYDTGTDQSSSVHDTIFYRRSLPVDAANNDILWEPTPAYIVSIDTSNADTTRWVRTANRHPSLTIRAPNPISEDSTVYVTVVWTCAPAQGVFDTDSTLREVCQRTFRVGETLAYLNGSGIETINHYHGSVANAWGTPVVSRLDGAYAFAWSDSVDGIVAKLKRVSDTAQWWLQRRHYDWSNLEMVSSGLQSCQKPSMFPSMPPFAHITGRDSSISIVWQRTTCNNKNTVMFKRLWHVETGDSAPTLSSNNIYNFCVPPGKFYHPSIDLWQDVWTNLYEAVTWEESVSPDVTTAGRTIIHFQPMHTSLYRCFDTLCATGTTLWDSMSAPSLPWTGLAFDANMEPLITHEADSAWPSIAALNEVVDLETQSDTGRFAIAFFDWTSNSDPRMRVAKILYGVSPATSEQRYHV